MSGNRSEHMKVRIFSRSSAWREIKSKQFLNCFVFFLYNIIGAFEGRNYFICQAQDLLSDVLQYIC